MLAFVSPSGSAFRARTGAELRLLASALDTTHAAGTVEVVLGLLVSVGPPAYKYQQVLAARDIAKQSKFLESRESKLLERRETLSCSRAVLGALSATLVVVTLSAVPFELYALGGGDRSRGRPTVVMLRS